MLGPLVFVFAGVWATSAAQNSSLALNCSQFRLPPASVNASFTNSSSSSAYAQWASPPRFDFGWGHWFQALSSRPLFQQLVNSQDDIYPVLPSDNTSAIQQIDLSSYSIGNSSKILTTYGIDTALSGPTDQAWSFNVSGGGTEQSRFGWVAWGQDSQLQPFWLTYEAALSNSTVDQPDGLTLYSAVEGGPDNQTLATIVGCVAGLGNDYLTNLAKAMKPTIVNGARSNTLPISCDAACRANNNTLQSGS